MKKGMRNAHFERNTFCYSRECLVHVALRKTTDFVQLLKIIQKLTILLAINSFSATSAIITIYYVTMVRHDQLHLKLSSCMKSLSG